MKGKSHGRFANRIHWRLLRYRMSAMAEMNCICERRDATVRPPCRPAAALTLGMMATWLSNVVASRDAEAALGSAKVRFEHGMPRAHAYDGRQRGGRAASSARQGKGWGSRLARLRTRRPAHALGRGRRLDGEHLLGLLGLFSRRLLGRFLAAGFFADCRAAGASAPSSSPRRRASPRPRGRGTGRRLLRRTRAGEYGVAAPSTRDRRGRHQEDTGRYRSRRRALRFRRSSFRLLGLRLFLGHLLVQRSGRRSLARRLGMNASTASCVKDDGKGTEGGFARPPKPRAVSIHCFLGSVASVRVGGTEHKIRTARHNNGCRTTSQFIFDGLGLALPAGSQMAERAAPRRRSPSAARRPCCPPSSGRSSRGPRRARALVTSRTPPRRRPRPASRPRPWRTALLFHHSRRARRPCSGKPRRADRVRLQACDGGRRGEGQFLRPAGAGRVRQRRHGRSLVHARRLPSSSSEAVKQDRSL